MHKKILIISPHFPPCNLAGVHRARLFAQHLPVFGWEPVVLTVDEKSYEEAMDQNLLQLVSKDLQIVKVKAFDRIGPVGDIGLRAFFQLYSKAKEIIMQQRIHFLYIPIPSFYAALLGRWLHSSTNIRYGIDYIDPWVHHFPGSDKIGSKHWWSSKLAKILEPIAIKKAVLITGVAEGYYQPVLERNPHLLTQAVHGAMPYGGEAEDHNALAALPTKPALFIVKPTKFQLLYAGAMLPKAYGPLHAICKSITHNAAVFADVEFHFIGTGKTSNDAAGYNIKPIAETYGLWQKNIFEYPARIPYLDVLNQLSLADGVFILGSTEPHYTPSKTYQAVLSRKPLLAVLHNNSTASEIITGAAAGIVLSFNGEDALPEITEQFAITMNAFRIFAQAFKPENVNTALFNTYSAKEVTRQLAQLLDAAIEKNDPLKKSKSP